MFRPKVKFQGDRDHAEIRLVEMHFLGGSPRSGTTLVQRIMGAHPDVFAGPEFGFVPDAMRLTQERMKDWVKSGAMDQLMDEETLNEATQAFFEKIIQTRLDIEDKTVFSEKTPGNAMVFGHLTHAMPDARLIMVLRNPFDIINSMKSVARRFKKSGQSLRAMKTVRRAVEWMNAHLEPGLEGVTTHDQVMIVYYEDLISDTENTVKKICAHCGLAFRPEMLDIENGSYRTVKKTDDIFYTKEQLEGPLVKDRLVSKSFDLSPMEIAVVEEYCFRHEAMERYFLPDKTSDWRRFVVRATARVSPRALDRLISWSW